MRLLPIFKAMGLFLLIIGFVAIATQVFTNSSQAFEIIDAKQNSKSKDRLFYDSIGNLPKSLRYVSQNDASNKFAVELFQSEEEREVIQKIAELKSRQLDCYYSPFAADTKIIYRIRCGMYSNEKNAQKNLRKYATQNSSFEAKVVKLN